MPLSTVIVDKVLRKSDLFYCLYFSFNSLYVSTIVSYTRAVLLLSTIENSSVLEEVALIKAMLIISQTGTDEPRENVPKYLKIAADGELPDAKYLFGILYERGLFGVSRDPKKAATLKAKALQTGIPKEKYAQTFKRLDLMMSRF